MNETSASKRFFCRMFAWLMFVPRMIATTRNNKRSAPIVDYGNHKVSDAAVRLALERIAAETERPVLVTSGDRDWVPKGGASNSLHLYKSAVDFHVKGLPDGQVFDLLRTRRSTIFGDAKGKAFRYQVIQHGPNTITGGAHIHLGIVPEPGEKYGRGFLVEGMTSLTRGQYKVVEPP